MKQFQKVIIFLFLSACFLEGNVVAKGMENAVFGLNTSQNDLVVLLKNEKNVLPLVDIDSTKNIVLLLGADSLPVFSEVLKKYSDMPVCSLPSSAKGMSVELVKKINLAETIICILLAPDKEQLLLLENLSQEKKLLWIHFYSANYFVAIPYLLEQSSSVLFASENTAVSQALAAQILLGGRAAKGGIKIYFPPPFEKTRTIQTYKTRLSYQLPLDDYDLKSELAKNIEKIINLAQEEKSFPACQVLVAYRGAVIYEKSFGTYRFDDDKKVTNESIFDLASVSKASATLPAVMLGYEAKKIGLNQEVGELLPYYSDSNKSSVKIRNLLNHSSGFVPTINFFEQLIDHESYTDGLLSSKEDSLHTLEVWPRTWVQTSFSFKSTLVSDSLSVDFPYKMAEELFIAKNFVDTMKNMIASSPRKNIGKYKYSCVNFILLREAVEATMEKQMDSLLYQSIYEPLGANTLCFNPRTRFDKERFVPSQNDLFLRKQELVGYVDDESAACFGGVSGNAGLFSSANDLAKLYQMFLNEGIYGGKQYFDPKTVKKFTKRDGKIKNRSLGFAMPRFEFFNNFKKKLGSNLYGHTGFTGTCVWVDPDKELIFIFLSNRTYPTRTNTKLSDLSIRTKLLEAIYLSLFPTKTKKSP